MKREKLPDGWINTADQGEGWWDVPDCGFEGRRGEMRILLRQIAFLGVNLRCRREGESELVANPASKLDAQMRATIKRNKEKIIRAIQDLELFQTGKFVNDRQVFEFARDHFNTSSPGDTEEPETPETEQSAMEV